jgi:hypothetical protein
MTVLFSYHQKDSLLETQMTQTNVRQLVRTCAVLLAFCLGTTTALAQEPGPPQVTLLPDNSVIITYDAPVTPPAGTLLVGTFNGAPIGPFAIGRSTTISSGAALPPGAYTVQVVWGSGVASPVTAFVVPPGSSGPPITPTLLSPIINGNTVTLTWTPVANATSYEIEAIVALSNQIVRIPVGNQNSITLPDVPFGSYVVRVRARNVSGFGPFSNQILVALEPTFRLRDLEITLTWNTTTDLDLHVIEPDGTRVWWQNRHGRTIRLVRDNTTGFGPEVAEIELGGARPGVYQVYIVHYRGQAPTTATITLTLGVGTANPQTKVITRQTVGPASTTGLNVALVDVFSGTIGDVGGTRTVPQADGRGKP